MSPELARRDVQVAHLRRALSRLMGSLLANLLCQQYFVRSEGLDFTTDPRVACFFASRGASTYELPAEPLTSLGVVYRMRLPDLGQSAKLWASHSRRAGYRPDPTKDVAAWFTEFVRDEELQAAGTSANEVVGDLGLANVKELFTMHGFIDWARVQDVLAEIVNDPTCIAHPLDEPDVGRYRQIVEVATKVKELAPSSRWAAQSGCLVVPQFFYRAHLPRFVRMTMRDRRTFWLTPPVAVGYRSVGMDNIRSGPVERFYFRHGPESGAITDPAVVWPNKTDGLLEWLLDALPALAEASSNGPSDLTGLLDLGYASSPAPASLRRP